MRSPRRPAACHPDAEISSGKSLVLAGRDQRDAPAFGLQRAHRCGHPRAARDDAIDRFRRAQAGPAGGNHLAHRARGGEQLACERIKFGLNGHEPEQAAIPDQGS